MITRTLKFLISMLEKLDKTPKEVEKKEHRIIVRDESFSEEMKYDDMIARNFQRSIRDDARHSHSHAMDSSNNTNNNIAFNRSVPTSLLYWFGTQSFIGFQMCAILAQHWLILKCCSAPARDAVRRGYEITSNDGNEIPAKVLDAIVQEDIKYSIKKEMREFITKGKIFGFRIAMFKVESEDEDYYKNPFNIDGVMPGSYKGIVQIDPDYITPEFDMDSSIDPTSLHFFEPTWWRVSGELIHRTHLIIFRNGELADRLRPTYFYGGIPLPQQIYERVYCAERTANEAPQLAISKRTRIYKTNVAKYIANQESAEKILKMQQAFATNFSKEVIDKTDDDMMQFDTSLSDFSQVIGSQYELVASVASVPVTKLFGTSPKGMNATGEYDESNYHEELEGLQENDLTPLIERHHQLLIRSEICPRFNIDPFKTSVKWNPLDARTAEEQASLNKAKADTDAVYIQNGALSPSESRKRLINDPESGYNGISDDEVQSAPGDPIPDPDAINMFYEENENEPEESDKLLDDFIDKNKEISNEENHNNYFGSN